MHRRSPSVLVGSALAFVAVAACGDIDGYEGIQTPAARSVDDGTGPLAECPADALDLREAVSGSAHRIPITWRAKGLDAILDDFLYVRLPDDVLSVAVSVEQDRQWTAVNLLALNGEMLLDLRSDVGEPPFFHEPVEVATVAMPVSEATRPQGGCLAIDPVAYDTSSGAEGTIHVVLRRGDPQPTSLDLAYYVVGPAPVTDDQLAAATDRMAQIYASSGVVEVGNVEVFAIDGPEIMRAEGRQPNELRAGASGAAAHAVPVFFVRDFDESGTLGIAAGTPGPNGVPGTAASGVIVSIDTHLDDAGDSLLTDLLGETLAHEVGHQLGLFHTSEDRGDLHDPLEDTPECTRDQSRDRDRELSAEECDGYGGRNFMFWTASETFAQNGITPNQAAVLRDSVVAQP